METRQLGDTDLQLTVVGLGTWAIGGEWFMGWGPQTEKDSIAAILEALELGINWIDTAPAYGFGRAEEVVGKALKRWGQPVLIATKCGVLKGPDGKSLFSIKRESIFKEVEDSLRRLAVDVIDLYQIHWPREDIDIEEGFQALLDLKAQGKIRHAAVSNFSREQLERISKYAQPASLQPPYSLLKREVEKEILPWCKTNKVGVVAYSPMQNGLLTGKFSAEWIESLPRSDWRRARWGRLNEINYFAEPELSGLVELVEQLKSVAARRDRTVGQLAVSWVLRKPEITAAIVGARKKGQIAETAQAADWKLTNSEVEEIEKLYREYQSKMGR
jgi:aryl-alcohol dehydrogenase-like predicted oxidoreductase